MNNVLSQNDKRGGRLYPQFLLQGFQEVLNECNLIDMNLAGHQYTWERGNNTGNHIEVRLDRALVTLSFLNMIKEARLTNLEVSTSDHSPLWLEPEVSILIKSKKTFRFENVWLREPMCYQLVEDVWSNSVCSFYEKLKICANVLSDWGKEITGDFKGRIHKSKKTIQVLKGRKDDISLKLIHEEKKALTEIYAHQEVFWSQRSKQLWLREGDQNNKYFHRATKNRRKANHIGTLYDSNGNKVTWG